MPRVRQRRHDRRSWGENDLLLLRDGHGFGQSIWGDYLDYPLDRRDEWPSAEALEDMQAAWQHHGAQLKQQHPDESPLWGELFFEHGLSAKESRDEHNRQWRTRNGLPNR